ncbi:MAG: MBL fold metallo-hydrolase [Peptostreptococcaceae bacterium]|nr:MBL fold metallo-hydrolase [Peptostreptococcaceae bacterium]
MKLKVLLDNCVDDNTGITESYFAEPGVSFYIEDEGTKILFDMGYSGIFLDNAKIMGLDLSDLDVITFSHGHDDHTGGIVRFNKEVKSDAKIVCHKGAFEKKISNNKSIGMPVMLKELEEQYNVITSETPVKISKNITYLGEIPVTMNFEPRYEYRFREIDSGKVIGDSMLDDSALVYEGDNGIYIITGCSHSGICNIVEYAKKITGKQNVLGLIGGLHLFNPKEYKVKKTIEYFENEKIPEFYPSHCTSFEVRATMYNRCGGKSVLVGMELEWK